MMNRVLASALRVALAGTACAFVLLAASALLPAASLGQTDSYTIGTLLKPATPRVTDLRPQPPRAPIRLADGLRDWPGALSHIAGSAHYDRGEWIYENYPYAAYGAALPGMVQLLKSLGLLSHKLPPTRRLPGGLSEVQGPAGAGPLNAAADLWQLRVAVRGPNLYVLARTTTMDKPVTTALLLLFNTGRGGGVSRTVPFGSGLHTTHANMAALVTAKGTRIVNLVTGKTTIAPAAADPAHYENSLETRLPLSLVTAHGGGRVRMVAATGVVKPGSFTLQSNGSAGPLADVAPNFGGPVQAVHDRAQAVALYGHDIDQFFTAIPLRMLRAGASQRLTPGVGYTVRTFLDPASISTPGGVDSTVRAYGLYIPRCSSHGPMPATLLLRGSGMTESSLAAITPGIFHQLGDGNCAVVISPGARADFDDYENAAYLDALHAVSDTEHLLRINRNRLTVAGYSMGGYATYMFADTRPDMFAAAFVVEGPVGGIEPASANSVVFALPNVIPSLCNLFHTPIEIYQGSNDADVPISNALAAQQRLSSLGLRYKLNLLPGNDHFDPGILNDYTVGARYLKGKVRVTHPAEVRFSRVMKFEHEINTGVDSDQPTAGRSMGLQFDRAWFVSQLDASNPVNGTATIDVRTLARPAGKITPVTTRGVNPGHVGGQPPSPYVQQTWRVARATGHPQNTFVAKLTGASHVTLALAQMGLIDTRPLTARIDTNTRLAVDLRLPTRACVAESIDSTAATRPVRASSLTVPLRPGSHVVQLRPCT